MVSNILGRRHSTSELSLLRSPASQVSTIQVDEKHTKHPVMTSPRNKFIDNGKLHQNLSMKERLKNLRSRSFLSQQQQEHTPSKRVIFSKAEPERWPTWSRSNFSRQECRSYWVQPEETKASIERNWAIIDAHEKSKINKDSTFHLCTRGLEAYILERQRGKKIHSTKQKNAHTAVLLWGKGLNDEERARRYQLVSKRCVKRALEYARRDAIVARRILKEGSCPPPTSDSQRSERSCSSTISTQSDLNLPCVPKSRYDAWSKTGKKKKKEKLRSCLKQATGTIPEILPIIYVRTRVVHVSAHSQRKGRSKTRLPSTKRTGSSDCNRRTAPRRANSTSVTLLSPRQLQKSNRSSSLPRLLKGLPLEEDTRKQTNENRDLRSDPDMLAKGGPEGEIQLLREAVIARHIHSAFPRCPRPSRSESSDYAIDESSPSVTTDMPSIVPVQVSSKFPLSDSLELAMVK